MAGKNVLAVVLACMMAGQPGSGLAQQTPAQQPALPDGPKPQVIPDAPRPVPLGPVTPGKGTTPDSNGASTSEDGAAVPDKLSQAAAQKEQEQELPPDTTSGPQYVLHVQTNFVEIPFTVKDNKGNQVAGLTWRDVRVYENNLRQQLAYFTVDPFPLSVALVIDQSVEFDIMTKVNNSLAALRERLRRMTRSRCLRITTDRRW